MTTDWSLITIPPGTLLPPWNSPPRVWEAPLPPPLIPTDGGITTGINLGTSDIVGTTADINLTNFDVTGSNGNITTAGTLAVNGDQITSDGNLVINATSTDIQDPLTADSLTLDTGALAINNAGGITSNQATLIVNAGGNVDVQDALNADSITSDAGVSIAAGNAYTGAGAVTLSSGAGALTLDANNGNVTLNTDDDLIPTLGAGDADLGASGTRWDNLFAVAGNFSGNVDVASGVDITGANLTVGATNFVVTVGSGNVDTQGTIQAGSGNITLTDATGNIQAGAYALASIDGDDLNSNLAGNGLTLTAASPDVLNIALDSAAADGSVGPTVPPSSGLEFDSGELTLIRGCGANQILKWDNVNFEWDCADDDDAGLSTESLDTAYDQGGSITVDAYDVLFTLADATNDYGLVIDNNTAGDIATALEFTTTGVGGTFATAIDTSDGGITTGINLGTSDIVGTTADINLTNFDVTGSNGNITTAGTLAVNGDQITSDGNLVINATSTDIQDPLTADSLTLDTGALAINNAGGITSNQATLIVNAGGNVDVQDALNADSITSDAGVSIAAGNAYTGAGAVTLSSAAGTALTINSGTTGTLAIGDDGSAETINLGTGAAAKTLVLGSTNTTSSTAIRSGSGGVNINASINQPMNIGTGTSTGLVTIGGSAAQTISIANGAAAKTLNLGSSNTTSTTTLLSGSGGINLNASNNQPVNVATGTSAGLVTIGGSAAQSIAIGNGAAAKTVTLGSTNTTSTTTIQSGTGNVNFSAGSTGDFLFNVDDDSTLILTGSVTNTGSLQDINLTLGNDAGADTVAGLQIDVTSVDTGADSDVLLGLNIGNLTGGNANVTERALQIGTGWDMGIDVQSGGITISSGALAINNASGITSNQATLIINASGTVDVQDALNADSITSDAGVSIAAGNSYTGAGAVTFSSGGGAGLTIDSANGTITIQTDDDLIPTLGAGDADIGASGTRWDNIYALNSNFSGTVTANDFSCTDCLDFAELVNGMTVDEATTMASTLAATTLDLNVSPAGTAASPVAFEITPTWGIDATDQTLYGLQINPNTNGNTDAGDVLGAMFIGNITGTAGTERAITIGTGWDTGLEINSGGINVVAGGITIASGALAVNSDSITSDGATLTINAAGTVDVDDVLNANSITSDAGVSIAAGNAYTGAGAVTVSSGGGATITIDSANGSVTFQTDDDLIPTLGAGDADLGSSGLRWDNVFATVGNYASTLNADGTVTIGTGGNTFTFDPSSGPTYAGTARISKTMTLHAEYAGATLSDYYGAGTDSNTSGTMIADVEPNATDLQRTYYEWERGAATQHFQTVAVRVTLPQDFAAWQTSNAMVVDFETENTTSTNSDVDVRVYLESDATTAVATSADNASSVANTWETVTIDDSVLDDGGAPEWDAAGETVVIYLRMGSQSGNHVRVGDITLNYLAQF